MAEQKLKNEYLEITIKEHGAELTAIKKNGADYLWNADPAYWGKVSPVLFPFVGRVEGGVYRHQGTEYPMGVHGFVRDMEFEVISRTETEIWYRIAANEETKKVYPFDFVLECGYRLEGSKVIVSWNVKNVGTETMYFAIGAHPAFLCPPFGQGKQTDCFLGFDSEGPLAITKINEKGLALPEQYMLALENGKYQLEEHTFDEDALVIETDQVHSISLLDANQEPYVTVTFDAPLVGIWSPAKMNAPFLCIEPWYGRCDGDGYQGELADREWENAFAAGEQWSRSYTIEIM